MVAVCAVWKVIKETEYNSLGRYETRGVKGRRTEEHAHKRVMAFARGEYARWNKQAISREEPCVTMSWRKCILNKLTTATLCT